MKQDKFLTGILAGIATLIIIALVVFFLRKDETRVYLTENTPEAVVHNYVLAILEKDYPKAYEYLADQKNKPTYAEFRQAFFNGSINPVNIGVDVGAAEIHETEAIVSLSIYYANTDPFSSRYSTPDSALLVMQNGVWKLNSMPQYTFWAYDWYVEQP